jgi:alpha-beta hydrolase superfamily lysophospholipase
MRRHPWLTAKGMVTGNTMLGLDTPARARESMFSAETPESQVVRHVARFQQESKRALYIDMTFRALPRPQRVSVPLLVLGAQCDGTITTDEVRATATAYRTEAEIFLNMGHDMMLEPGWQAVAERIHAWLETRGLRLDDDGTSN